MNSRYAHCAKCQEYSPKRFMRPIFTSASSSAPPKILCYLCESCYCDLLDYLEISDVCKFTYLRPPEGENNGIEVTEDL